MNRYIIIFLFSTQFLFAQNLKNESLSTELLEVGQEWISAWNGKVDKDRMMSFYHTDMQYYWRGKPMDYNTFDMVVEKYIAPTSNYDIYLHDEIVTILDDDAAVVSFNWTDKNKTEPPASVSLTMKKEQGEWKVIHVHESPVRPIQPDNFEQKFNEVSNKYQNDYMNARCEQIIPILNDDLVIYENGEEWPLEKVKQFCQHLPVKPVLSTDRSYKFLEDNQIYEFVSQKYQIVEGRTFVETQSRIWQYDNSEWKIIQLDVSRYRICNEN